MSVSSKNSSTIVRDEGEDESPPTGRRTHMQLLRTRQASKQADLQTTAKPLRTDMQATRDCPCQPHVTAPTYVGRTGPHYGLV